MKRIIFCLTALLVLVACNNKSQENNNEAAATNEPAQTEAPATAAPEEDGEWMKQTTLLSSKPMVVDFFATWCGPCKELTPILDEIEKKFKGQVIFERIDVDQKPELAQEFGIQAIPMLMFVTPKGEYQTLVGLQSPEVIESKITALLAKSAK